MARYLPFIMLCLIVAMGGHFLQAADHPDFSGVWALDLNAPEATSMEAMLAAQGVSWINRKLADTLAMTQVITQTDKTLTIQVSTALGTQTQILTMDGSSEIRDTDRKIGKVASRSFWDKTGSSLVTVSNYTMPDGQKAEWTIRRYLKDEGRSLIVDHLLIIEDGRKLIATRVLRRQRP